MTLYISKVRQLGRETQYHICGPAPEILCVSPEVNKDLGATRDRVVWIEEGKLIVHCANGTLIYRLIAIDGEGMALGYLLSEDRAFISPYDGRWAAGDE